MRECYRRATARKRAVSDVPMVRVSRPSAAHYGSREMPDIYDARRMIRRLVRLMERAGWTLARAYALSWDGGATVTAEMVRADDVCRVSVDGGPTTWRGMWGVKPEAFFVAGGSR